jgi:hypothetical protein
LQLSSTTNVINLSLSGNTSSNETTTIILGVVLGVVIAFAALKNIMLRIRFLNTCFLPLLMVYYLYTLFSSNNTIFTSQSFGISAACIATYMSFFFSGIVNLPTFFRHARSKYDSYIALTLITLIVSFFQISSIWISYNHLNNGLFQMIGFSLLPALIQKSAIIIFCLLALFCSNLVNIYFSLPSFELLFPRIKKSLLCLLVGLIGTMIYVFKQMFFIVDSFIEQYIDISDYYIADLGASLLLIFLLRIIVRHRPKPFEKLTSAGAWIIGCITTTLAAFKGFHTTPLLAGIGATFLCYIVVFFIEEPFWSIKKLRKLLTQKSS